MNIVEGGSNVVVVVLADVAGKGVGADEVEVGAGKDNALVDDPFSLPVDCSSTLSSFLFAV